MVQIYGVKLYCARYKIKFTSKSIIDVNYKCCFLNLELNEIIVTIILPKDFLVIGIQPSFQNCSVNFSEIFGVNQITVIQFRKVWKWIQKSFFLESAADEEHLIGRSMVGSITRILRNSSPEF